MALKKSITKDISINNADIIKSTGVDVPSVITLSDVYFKIRLLEGNKNDLRIYVDGIYIYKTDESIPEIKETVYNGVFYFTPSIEDGSSNFIKQGYKYLKTLDEFKDAIDC